MTKDNVSRLEEKIETLRAEMNRLATREELHAAKEEQRGEIHRLEERMDSPMKWMIGLLVTIWGTVAAIGLAALKLLAGG